MSDHSTGSSTSPDEPPDDSLHPASRDLLGRFGITDQERFIAAYAANTLSYLRKHRPAGTDDFQHFLAAAGPLAHQSKSQNFQDLWALWENGMRRDKYFVEFGAGNGVRLSNTYLLEKAFGWIGIAAEPHPAFWTSLDQHRTCIKSALCVYPITGRTIEFLALEKGELSRVASIAPEDKHERNGTRQGGQRVSVETISLNDLLATAGAPCEIDYLSIDTEGSELAILSAVDFDRWRFRTISVEHNYTPDRIKLHTLLTRHGYRRKWTRFSRFDDWYVASGRPSSGC